MDLYKNTHTKPAQFVDATVHLQRIMFVGLNINFKP
jgi:hypothetical protein